jgi:P-type Ca2+ transporter type 2B
MIVNQVSEYGGVHEIARKLNTSEATGLSGEKSDLEHRRDYFGSNIIPPKPPKTFLQVKFVFTFHTYSLIVLKQAKILIPELLILAS